MTETEPQKQSERLLFVANLTMKAQSPSSTSKGGTYNEALK